MDDKINIAQELHTICIDCITELEETKRILNLQGRVLSNIAKQSINQLSSITKYLSDSLTDCRQRYNKIPPQEKIINLEPAITHLGEIQKKIDCLIEEMQELESYLGVAEAINSINLKSKFVPIIKNKIFFINKHINRVTAIDNTVIKAALGKSLQSMCESLVSALERIRHYIIHKPKNIFDLFKSISLEINVSIERLNLIYYDFEKKYHAKLCESEPSKQIQNLKHDTKECIEKFSQKCCNTMRVLKELEFHKKKNNTLKILIFKIREDILGYICESSADFKKIIKDTRKAIAQSYKINDRAMKDLTNLVTDVSQPISLNHNPNNNQKLVYTLDMQENQHPSTNVMHPSTSREHQTNEQPGPSNIIG